MLLFHLARYTFVHQFGLEPQLEKIRPLAKDVSSICIARTLLANGATGGLKPMSIAISTGPMMTVSNIGFVTRSLPPDFAMWKKERKKNSLPGFEPEGTLRDSLHYCSGTSNQLEHTGS